MSFSHHITDASHMENLKLKILFFSWITKIFQISDQTDPGGNLDLLNSLEF